MAFGATAASAAAPSTVTEVIVTGTRASGVKAGDSSAPVLVVGGDALKNVGAPNLVDSMALSVPSFITESLGADLGNVVTSASLRGLSPNDTLVMIDGKRRHPTGMLHVDPGDFQGAFSPDLSLIPAAAIDHMEVLTNGASAQYGSDAIAGVVNIMLKKADHGGSITALGGQYFKGDGKQADLSLNFGLPLGQHGFVNITAEERYHGFSQRGGPDVRLYNENGTPLPGTPAGLPNAPRVNHIDGDGMSQTSLLFVNAGYDFGGVEAYAIGSYAHRNAWGFENFRTPCKIVASSTLTVPGSCPPGPGDIQPFPLGFNPKEFVREDDYGLTAGVKGTAAGWRWDLSTTWGEDYDPQWTIDSANRSLFIDTHFTPRNFYDGAFRASEWTTNLDLNRDFDLGMAGPMNVAFGGETRTGKYTISQGDAGSIYKEGGQSFPGYQPTDAGSHTRTNYSGYVDFALNPMTGWKVDLAGRAEHYSDFGNTSVGQLTTRYDFSPQFALRGTIASGFRAPTLAEEFYSATNVSPTFAVVTLPADTSAAHLLGFSNLKPEKSTNYSVGFVSEPMAGFRLTMDAYQIDIADRIVATGTILGKNGSTIVNANVLAAIAAHGNILDPGVSFVGVTVFTNGVDTRTQGLELTANWTNSGDWGRIDWTLLGNYNKTTITHFAPTPAPIASAGALLSPEAISNLTVSQPLAKIILNAKWTKDRWWVNLRETIYGPTAQWVSPDGTGSCDPSCAATGAYKEQVPWTPITNLELGYHITDRISAAVGANNLFDKNPPGVRFCPAAGITCDGQQEALVWDAPVLISPYGINGGFYYGRVSYTW
jgi:iron complex outermembrane receptor protein